MEKDKTAALWAKALRSKLLLRHPPDLNPEDLLSFVELPGFTRDWEHLGLDDDDRRALYLEIMTAPLRWPVMQGTGGLRKMRFRPEKWNIGKRGAVRVCFAFFGHVSIVILVSVFRKSEKDDLSPRERRQIRNLLAEIKREFEKGPKKGT